jgi:hypothetical protein
MTETGVVAIVSASIAAVGVVTAAYIKRPKPITPPTFPSGPIQENFGFSAQEAYSHVEIDKAGNTKAIKGWRGIQLRKGTVMAQIPGRLWIDTPGGKIDGDPRLTKHTELGKNVSLVIRKKTDTECDYSVEITGYLTGDDPPLDYEIVANYSKAVLMTKQAVAAAYASASFKFDYHSFDVEYPIESLSLEVTFEQGVSVQAFGGVFLGRSENQDAVEFQRVQKGFTPQSRGGRFVIRKPNIGYRYFIYWAFTV